MYASVLGAFLNSFLAQLRTQQWLDDSKTVSRRIQVVFWKLLDV
jgi:hypothetical protein